MVDRAYDAVLFDFSGVMTTSAFDALAKLGAEGERDRTLELLLGPYHDDTDHPWHRVERGELAISDWFAAVSATAVADGVEIDWSLLGNLLADLDPHPSMEAEVRRLAADGYALALVTNNVREGSAAWRSLVPVDELFDVVIDSSEVGMRKPDPRIYQLALERLGGIAAERAVFLDDALSNVEGARRAGLTAILVSDPDTAIGELRTLLGR